MVGTDEVQSVAYPRILQGRMPRLPNMFATHTTLLRKRQPMIPNTRITVAALVGAATIAAVVGCSTADTPSSGMSTTAESSASASSQPAATASASPAPTSRPETTAGGVDVTIAPQGGTNVRPGGPPMRFTVTLVNNGADIAAVGMVVSLGHCSCGPPGARMMAEGSMRMLDPQTNAWVTVPYVREGTGMDYISQNLVRPFPLIRGRTVTYQLEMQLNAEQGFNVTKGKSSIGVTLTDPDNPLDDDGLGDGDSLPITVEAS